MRIQAVLLFLFVSLSIFSQSVEISGSVVDQSGKAMEGVTVAVENTHCGTNTSETGQFRFECKTAFPFVVSVSMIGYERRVIRVEKAVDASNLKITLSASDKMLDEVDVKARKTESTFQRIDASHAAVVVDASGGIEGLLKTQIGVASGNELSSQYRVRGGNFDENMIYVNNTEIYRPFLIRSGEQEGLSFVNPDLVESVDFSAGGFDASYGDRMSSVLDVKYRKPTKSMGGVTASLLGASAHAGGSALKGRLTHVTGMRYKTNQYLLGSLDMKGDYSPSFLDMQSYITFTAGKQWSFDVLGYYARNRYRFVPQNRETSFGTISEVKKLKIYFEGEEDDRYQTGLVTGSANYRPSNRHLFRFSGGMFRSFEEENYDILGEYWLQQVLGGNVDSDVDQGSQNIGIGGYLQHARNELLGVVTHQEVMGNHYFENHTIRWELKYQREKFSDYLNEWEMRDSAGYSVPGGGDALELAYHYNARLKTASDRFSAYVKDDLAIGLPSGQLSLVYGIRASYWSFNDETIVSPRVSMSFVPSQHPDWRYRLATGIYYQAPFYREIRSPEGKINKNIKSQKSVQILAGTDYYFEIGEQKFKFTAEAYYKHLSRLIPYQVDNVRIRYSGINNAHGYATGIDLKLNGEFVPGAESWVGLSLMRSEEDIDDDFYVVADKDGNSKTVYPGYIPRPSDQRLNFSLFFQDYLPNNPYFRMSLNMLYGTGLPFGPPNSARYMAVNRMPAYRRVDMGLSRDLKQLFGGSSAQTGGRQMVKEAWIGLEIFNLFNFSNTLSYFWVTDIDNRQFAVPNYLTSRRINLKVSVSF
jgi:hypothetical protein